MAGIHSMNNEDAFKLARLEDDGYARRRMSQYICFSLLTKYGIDFLVCFNESLPINSLPSVLYSPFFYKLVIMITMFCRMLLTYKQEAFKLARLDNGYAYRCMSQYLFFIIEKIWNRFFVCFNKSLPINSLEWVVQYH